VPTVPGNAAPARFANGWKPPELVWQWAGFRPGSDGRRCPAKVAAALGQLDALASDGRWLRARDLRYLIDKRTASVLALNEADPARRLRMAALQAYEEAYRVDTAHRQRMAELRRARDLASEILPAEDSLSALLAEGLPILDRWRWDNAASGRRESWSEVQMYLREIALQLRGLANLRHVRGNIEKTGRTFLLIRLGEIFALMTGDAPKFYAADSGNSRWHRFVSLVFSCTELPGRDQGIDQALRKIAREMELHRWTIEDLADRSAAVARGERPCKHVEYGELQSVGLLIDYKLLLPEG
jgi:hypothetical protein